MYQTIFLYFKRESQTNIKTKRAFILQRIRALKNVQFVDSRISSRGLINSCIGVATVTGTVSWESIFYQKPVLVFGNAWYRDFSGITKFNSKLTFEEWINSKRTTKSTIVKELDKLLMKTGKGIVDPDYLHLVRNFDVAESAKTYAESINKYLN